MYLLDPERDLTQSSLSAAIEILTDKTGDPPVGIIVSNKDFFSSNRVIREINPFVKIFVSELRGFPESQWVLYNDKDCVTSGIVLNY